MKTLATLALILGLPVTASAQVQVSIGNVPTEPELVKQTIRVHDLDDLVAKMVVIESLSFPQETRALLELWGTHELFVIRSGMDQVIPGVRETVDVWFRIERLREVDGSEPELDPLFSFRQDEHGNETFVDCQLVNGQTVMPASQSPCSEADRNSLTDLITFLVTRFPSEGQWSQWYVEGAATMAHTQLGPATLPTPGLATSTNITVLERVDHWNPADDPADRWEARFGDNYEH